MINYEPIDPMRTIVAVLLGGAVALLIVFSCIGCATTKCPECVPEVQVVSVSVPVPSCEPPAVLPMVEYPDWPTLVRDPSEGELKAFYAECVAVQHAREKIMLEAIRARDLILEEYRE